MREISWAPAPSACVWIMTMRGLRRARPACATALPARMSFGGKGRAILLTIVTFGQFLMVARAAIPPAGGQSQIFRTAKAMIGVLVYAPVRQMPAWRGRQYALL